MFSGQDASSPRDDYERLFLDKIKERSPGVFPAICDCLRLFERSRSKAPIKTNSLGRPELAAQMGLYVQRSFFYEMSYDLFGAHMAVDRTSSIYSKVNAVHVFGPFLLQELEGPLKKQLGIIHFLLGLTRDEDLDWPNCMYTDMTVGRQHTVGHLVDQIIFRASDFGDLRKDMEVFKGSAMQLDFDVVRNALGHSDYLVLPSERGLKVHLEAGDKTQEMDIDEFLTVFTGVQDLVRGLHTAILVIIHRLDERTTDPPSVTP
jgi:hypothetical protein